jgi:Helix-turn-helix domain
MAKMRSGYCQLRFAAIIRKTILIMIMASAPFDPYFVDVLMPDLVGHDRSPAAFVVYLYLWRRASLSPRGMVQASYATIAVDTGLSRITAQRAVALLRRRRLISSRAESKTSVPRYGVLRPWVGRIPGHA